MATKAKKKTVKKKPFVNPENITGEADKPIVDILGRSIYEHPKEDCVHDDHGPVAPTPAEASHQPPEYYFGPEKEAWRRGWNAAFMNMAKLEIAKAKAREDSIGVVTAAKREQEAEDLEMQEQFRIDQAELTKKREAATRASEKLFDDKCVKEIEDERGGKWHWVRYPDGLKTLEKVKPAEGEWTIEKNTEQGITMAYKTFEATSEQAKMWEDAGKELKATLDEHDRIAKLPPLERMRPILLEKYSIELDLTNPRYPVFTKSGLEIKVRDSFLLVNGLNMILDMFQHVPVMKKAEKKP